MITAARVLEVIDFLKPFELWSVMSDEGLRVTVFGVENNILKLEVTNGIQTYGQKVTMELLEGKEKDMLAFVLVQMAAKLGAYED